MARGIFGERLKRERELREVTLQEINSATRIGPRFLEALENEDWEKLPGGVFNRGFVRSVARFLGLDEEGLLAEYDLAHGAMVQAETERQENLNPAPPRWIPFAIFVGLIVLALCLIVGGIFAWRHYASRRAQKQSQLTLPQPLPQPLALVIPPASTPSALPSPAGDPSVVQQPLDLFVSASAATRLRVQSDGNLLFDTELRAGENRHFPAQNSFEVTAADSSAVLLELNGQTMPPLGVPGSSGTIKLSRSDLRQANSGNPQP